MVPRLIPAPPVGAAVFDEPDAAIHPPAAVVFGHHLYVPALGPPLQQRVPELVQLDVTIARSSVTHDTISPAGRSRLDIREHEYNRQISAVMKRQRRAVATLPP